MKKNPKHYTCGACKKRFERVTDDDEATEEYKAKFPGQTAAAQVRVCDDCYKMMGLDNIHQ